MTLVLGKSQVLYRMGILAALRSKVRNVSTTVGSRGFRDSTGGLVLLKPTSGMVGGGYHQRGWYFCHIWLVKHLVGDGFHWFHHHFDGLKTFVNICSLRVVFLAAI